MKQSYLKSLGIGCLWMLATDVAAFLMGLLQFAGKQQVQDYQGILFSGSIYRYHPVFYGLGLIGYLAALFCLYRYVLTPCTAALKGGSVVYRILFFVLGVVCAVLMLAALLGGAFLMLGLTDAIRPEVWMNVTTIGFPVGLLAVLVVSAVRQWRHTEAT